VNSLRVLGVFLVVSGSLMAQAPAAAPAAGRGAGRGAQGPQVISPEVSTDRHITFRIIAPQAQSVRVTGGDMPVLAGGGGRGAPGAGGPAAPAPPSAGQMKKDANGVWEVTLGPIDPGAYRYNFNVDGVTVIDSRNPATSESNATTWSLVLVPGSDSMDTKQVPHGAVAAVTYYSTALGKFRRMHVYTPPGYELGKDKYPVFYLLHGAGDSDDSWTSVGRAGIIVDNLLVAKKAKPMIVVMPAGHTTSTNGGRGAAPGSPAATPTAPHDEFEMDFASDVLPYVEKNYRVMTGRANRAIAGLSMGGSQTLNIAFLHPDWFAYVGVFSSGASLGGGGRGASGSSGGRGGQPGQDWETTHQAGLDDGKAKKGLKQIWFSTGVDDGLITNSKSTVEMLKKHGFDPSFRDSPGAHTWINWHNYLNEFTPLLFQ
jgi:enterochelin esterase-like enzyme